MDIPKTSLYFKRKLYDKYKYTGINVICEFIIKYLNSSHFEVITDINNNNNDIILSLYNKLETEQECCKIIMVYDIIYLYNEYARDDISQKKIIHDILSSVKKTDFLIFTSEYQRNKYLEVKKTYNYMVEEENTTVLYLPFRNIDAARPLVNSKKYTFFILIQHCKRKNPNLYIDYINNLKHLSFCIIISNQISKYKTNEYIKKYKYYENVTVFTNCTDVVMQQKMSESVYCLYLSDDEGTGLHAYECYVSDCIPIVKNNIVFNELFQDRIFYLENIYNITESCHYINYIIKMELILDKYKKSGADILYDNHIDIVCKRLNNIIYNFYKKYKNMNQYI